MERFLHYLSRNKNGIVYVLLVVALVGMAVMSYRQRAGLEWYAVAVIVMYLVAGIMMEFHKKLANVLMVIALSSVYAYWLTIACSSVNVAAVTYVISALPFVVAAVYWYLSERKVCT